MTSSATAGAATSDGIAGAAADATEAEWWNSAWFSWATFTLTIIFEVCGTTSLKLVQRSNWWYFSVYGFYAASLGIFPFVLRRIPLSVAYAAWSGLGTSLCVLVAGLLFKERVTWQMTVSIAIIIIGVVMLNYFSNAAGTAVEQNATELNSTSLIREAQLSGTAGVQPAPAGVDPVSSV